MENVVPGVLQRLRAADILRMAGLNAAALGQEYCRAGFVQETRRQGAKLFGVINSVHSDNISTSSNYEGDSRTGPKIYTCEVEVKDPTSWISQCTCNAETALLCPHAAALLYLWLSHSSVFVTATPSAISQKQEESVSLSPTVQKEASLEVAASPKPLSPRPATILSAQTPSANITELLSQSGLSELRGIAREYEIVSNGLNKQQLVEALVEALRQPEVVRRVATTLQKSQRQLLAAVTLAGGFVNDDDLRGLFERFSLGGPEQIQQVLLALQSKAFLFRTSMHNASSPRIGLSDVLLDSGWYVPLEVRTALRVTVPTTVFKLERGNAEQEPQPLVQHGVPYALLANLLLVARALDGYQLAPGEDWLERSAHARSHEAPSLVRAPGGPSNDGSVSVASPDDQPPSTLIDKILPCVPPLSPGLLRFAMRLLGLSEILYRDDEGTPYLHVLANAAQLFLGPNRAEVSRDLFELWLTQSSYAELYGLLEDNWRLRGRATALQIPVLRSGELAAENTAARQALLTLLAQVPLQQWVNFSAFARFVYRLSPLFLQRKQRLYTTPHWWLESEPGRPLRPLHLQDWLRAEAQYLARLLSGPLFWWGACDIATDHDGHLLAFRLTPVAAWLFSGSRFVEENSVSEDYSAHVSSLEIVDIEEILIACNVQNWPLIEVLETFTQAAGVRDGRLCYRLTPAALTQALGHGHNPATLLHLLRSAVPQAALHDGPLPHMLERLERWINSYGRMRVYTGVTLLESIDTVVMRELSATTTLDDQVVQAISPTLHILKKSGMEQIIDELKRRGQSPLLHDDFSIPFSILNTDQESASGRSDPDTLHEKNTSENRQGSIE